MWYRRAAGAGNVVAIHNLAFYCCWGRGLSQDHSEAARVFRMLAEQGNPTAQYNLGIVYLFGRGVTADLVEAHKWFKLAAAQGDKTAAKEMASTAALLSPESCREAELASAKTHQRYVGLLKPPGFPIPHDFGFVVASPPGQF
jgi:hypothetical protein